MGITKIKKAKLGLEDFELGTGTFQRPKSDGSLQTLTQVSLGSWIETARTPEDYGAVGDGVADDFDALTAMFADGGPVFIPDKTYASSKGPIMVEVPNTHVLCFGGFFYSPGPRAETTRRTTPRQ